jgi:hypothetical protein
MTNIQEQIEQMESLASRHYPESEAQRNACLVRLLKERLTTYAAMFQGLTVKDTMKEKP